MRTVAETSKNDAAAGAPGNGARRSFLARLAGGVVGVGALLTSWPFVRSLFPNVGQVGGGLPNFTNFTRNGACLREISEVKPG